MNNLKVKILYLVICIHKNKELITYIIEREILFDFINRMLWLRLILS